MAFSTQRAVSDGTLVHMDISIDYLDRTDIQVFYDDIPANPATWSWQGTTDRAINFSPAVPNGVEVLLARTTDLSEVLNAFGPRPSGGNAKFTAATMDENFRQLLLIAQEAKEGSTLSDIYQNLNMHLYRIINLGDPVDDGDAVNYRTYKADAAGAYASAQAAAASATTASNAATTATAQAGIATTQAGTATTQANIATGAATSATTQAGLATTARTAAEAARDLSKAWASQPTGDVDGTGLFSAVQYAALAAAWASKPTGTVDGTYLSAYQYAQLAAAGAGLPVYAANVIPTTNQGNIHVVGIGPMEWDATNSRYRSMLQAHGECRFDYTNATTCTLTPRNGRGLIIQDRQCFVPQGGVTFSNSGLAINTTYFAYVYLNGSGVMTGEWSTTAKAFDAASGVYIKSGDRTRTLVGMARTNGSSQFSSSFNNRQVASYFNRLQVTGTSQISTAMSVAWTSYSGSQIILMLWDDFTSSVDFYGSCNTTGGAGTQTFNVSYYAYAPPATPTLIGPGYGVTNTGANYESTVRSAGLYTGADGCHVVSPAARCSNNGFAASLNATLVVTNQI